MKLTVFLILLGLLRTSATSFAQNYSISLNLENVSRAEVFKALKKQTSLDFFYSDRELDANQKVQAVFNKAPLEKVLEEILGNGYRYRLVDQVVIIRPVKEPLEAPIKEVVIKGVVRNKDGVTLPGVTVRLKGSTIGTVTDVNGHFALALKDPPETVLTFSFVGMKMVEIRYNGEEKLEIVLEEEVTKIDEVVVTGYYTLSKERSAGAFSRVTAEEISMKSSASLVERMSGLIPGFVMNKVGEDKFLLRGMTSINSSREPLFVVDGMPVELNTLEGTVNPEDVVNITVLKDATASSIWGARASNGVIVITTKRGHKQEKLNVSYTGSVQLQGLPDFDYLDYMNARDYVDFIAENVYESDYNYENDVANYQKISTVERILHNRQQGKYTQEQTETELNRLRNSDNQEQLKDYLYRRKLMHQHSLNISGGGENMAFHFSVNYRNTKPQEEGVSEERLIVDLKNDFQPAPWLDLSLNANVATNKTKSGYVPNVIGMVPYELLADEKGNPLSQMHMFYSEEAIAWTQTELDKRNMPHYDFVMLNELNKQNNRNRVINTRLQAAMNVKLSPGLNFESQFMYQYGSGKSENLKKADSYFVTDLIASQTPKTEGSESRIPDGGILDKTWTTSTEWIIRNQISYNKNFTEKHQLNLLIGSEVRKSKSEQDNRIVYGYNENTKKFVNLDEAAMIAGIPGGSLTDPNSMEMFGNSFNNFGSGYYATDNRFFSLYANVAYNFDEKYGINASVRMDQANLFCSDIRYKPIWSVGVLWNLHQEEFGEHLFFDRLTLRASKGITGNTPNSEIGGPYDIISYDWPGSYFGWTKPSVSIISPALDNLKWEKTDITNVGVDFSVLSGRLSGSVDVYHKNTKDLIGLQTIDPTSGFSSISTNIGKLKNTGIELMLASINIQNPDFSWSTNFNFSYNKNKITDIYAEPTIMDHVNANKPVFIQGYEAYSLFSYRWAGLDDQGEPMVYDENGNKTAEQITDIKAIVHSGTAQPPFTGSLSNTFTYKNWQLSVLAIFNFGHKIRNDVFSPVERVDDMSSLSNDSPFFGGYHNDLKKAWKKAGDVTNVPRWLPKGSNRVNCEYYSAADINVIDGSYIYISDITLGYRLPQAWMQKIRIQGCTINAQVTDPFCWAFNNEGVDPRYMTSMVGYKRTLKYGPEYMLKLDIHF